MNLQESINKIEEAKTTYENTIIPLIHEINDRIEDFMKHSKQDYGKDTRWTRYDENRHVELHFSEVTADNVHNPYRTLRVVYISQEEEYYDEEGYGNLVTVPEYIFDDDWKNVELRVMADFKQYQKERNAELKKKEDDEEYKKFLKLKKKYEKNM
jgi:hypothetical protein